MPLLKTASLGVCWINVELDSVQRSTAHIIGKYNKLVISALLIYVSQKVPLEN